MRKVPYALLSLVSAVLFFSGCSAEPAKTTDFIPEPDKLQKSELVPFTAFWRNPEAAAKGYDKIMVEPVFTKDALSQRNWMERNNIRTWMEDENKDVAEFAKYTEESFKKALSKCQRFKLTDKAGPKTLVLELSLVKVVPGKPVAGAVSNLSNLTPIGFIISPLKVGAKASTDSPMQASVAIEGVIRDSETKEAVAAFVDREKQNSAFFNVNDFTAYSNLKNIVDEWSRRFVECIDKRPLATNTKIEKSNSVKVIVY